MKKLMYVAAAALTASLALVSCGGTGDDADATSTPEMSAELRELTQNTIEATIELENGDEINLELYPDLAPETVENFVELADEGFYDGLIFHRVIDGFMIQGGGYDEDLNASKADSITGEFSSNGFENELSHTRGVISMARASDPDSATSQFFIVQTDSTYLDGDYAAFGRVTDEESLDVVDDIASVKTGTVSSAGMQDVPVTAVVIKTIKITSGASSILGDKDDKATSKPASTGDNDKISATSAPTDSAGSEEDADEDSIDSEDEASGDDDSSNSSSL